MQSKTVLLFAFICMTTLYMARADKNQCMCVCCKTPGDCKQDFAEFSIKDCTDDKCRVACPSQYVDCRPPVDVSGSMCMADSAADNLGRRTVWGSFVLACIVTAVFRI